MRHDKIIKQLENAFEISKITKNFNILKCLIKKVGNFLDKDYSSIYWQIRESYQKDIDEYKKEKNLVNFFLEYFAF